MGYLPQQTQAQKDFPATVYEVALSGCLNQKGFHFFSGFLSGKSGISQTFADTVA